MCVTERLRNYKLRTMGLLLNKMLSLSPEPVPL